MSDNIEELLGKLDNLGIDAEETLLNGVLKACKKIQADSKRLASYDQVRNSITADAYIEGGDIVGEVGSNLDIATYTEFGTGPVGKASPKDAPPGLNLKYKTDGTTIKRRSKKGKGYEIHYDGWFYNDPKTQDFVYSEGQPAKPFLYPAFKRNGEEAKRLIAQTISEAIKKAME